MLRPNIVGLTNKKILVIALGVALVTIILVGPTIYQNYKNAKDGKIVFTVDDREYRQKEVVKLIKFSTDNGLDKNRAANEALSLYKKFVAGEKLGIHPTEDEIRIQRKDLLDGIRQTDNFEADYGLWFDLLAKANAIDSHISNGAPQGYKGYAFDVFFGQHMQYGPAFKPEGLNNQRLISSDKQYAKKQAEFYQGQLENGDMTADEVLEALNNDRRLSALPVGKTSHSVKFGYNKNVVWQEQVYYDPIIDFISGFQATGVSDIQVGKASVDSTAGSLKDMYYYFVLLEQIPSSKNVSETAYQKTLNNIHTEYRGL